MIWYAEIRLKSGNIVSISNLLSVNKKSQTDSSIAKIEDFKTFHLSPAQLLTFVGEKESVTLISNEIEYVKFFQD
ncbi:hypothetical protein [Thermotalea metallivorans]|uniref:Uncharacterized protein n=1 Tax=Thermotalea metallivorans TaxID=520762 RepID=A0A140LCH9_9FIRM|nr:hypothetical protein [Thermotalea metallivorans]KXG78254.1 hypothetical protein AN619_02290 [Thermotalea metallivorans]